MYEHVLGNVHIFVHTSDMTGEGFNEYVAVAVIPTIFLVAHCLWSSLVLL